MQADDDDVAGKTDPAGFAQAHRIEVQPLPSGERRCKHRGRTAGEPFGEGLPVGEAFGIGLAQVVDEVAAGHLPGRRRISAFDIGFYGFRDGARAHHRVERGHDLDGEHVDP